MDHTGADGLAATEAEALRERRVEYLAGWLSGRVGMSGWQALQLAEDLLATLERMR